MFAVGIDSVTIDRFIAWQGYSEKKLRRIFTHEELVYCFSVQKKIAERLAVRFAAREAFFKALHGLMPDIHIPLLTIIKNVSIAYQLNGAPCLVINWDALNNYMPRASYADIHTSISLTHTQSLATAIVLLRIITEVHD